MIPSNQLDMLMCPCSPQPQVTRTQGMIRTRPSIYRRRLLRAYEALAIVPKPLLPLYRLLLQSRQWSMQYLVNC